MGTGSIISKRNLSNSLQGIESVFDADAVFADANPDLFSFTEEIVVKPDEYISCSDIAALVLSQFGIKLNKGEWDNMCIEKRNEIISELSHTIIQSSYDAGKMALLAADIIILLYSNVVKGVASIYTEASKTSFDYVSAVNLLVNAWIKEENTPQNVYGFIINNLSLAGSSKFDSSFLFAEKGGENH